MTLCVFILQTLTRIQKLHYFNTITSFTSHTLLEKLHSCLHSSKFLAKGLYEHHFQGNLK